MKLIWLSYNNIYCLRLTCSYDAFYLFSNGRLLEDLNKDPLDRNI